MDFSALETVILALPNREPGPGASAEEIKSAEQALGVELSGGYRKFLEQFGWLGIGSFEIYGVGSGVPKHMDLVEITQSERRVRWPRLFGQILRLDKWIVCRG